MTKPGELLNKLTGRNSLPDGEDIALGLPLETGDCTIYPVFREQTDSTGDGSGPRQIGFLEVSESRSDFTSLEPDPRPLALLPVLLIVILAIVWLIWRSR